MAIDEVEATRRFGERDEFSLPQKARSNLVDVIVGKLPESFVGAGTREKWERIVDEHFAIKPDSYEHNRSS